MTIVHRFWVGPPREQHRWITESTRRAYPRLHDWTLETLPSELTKQLDSADDPRHLSNVVRYWLLYEQGGLYLDFDVIPFRDLTGSKTAWTAALSHHREGCVLWFPSSGHPMLGELLDATLHAPAGTPSPLRSGARVLQRVGLKYTDVGYEERVIPIDALGGRTPSGEVWAVKQWQTSSHRSIQRTERIEPTAMVVGRVGSQVMLSDNEVN